MKKTLYLIIASAAAAFGAPAIAAVDIAPSTQVYSASAPSVSTSSVPIVESAENFGHRRGFRKGFRSRSHRGFGRRHGKFGRHQSVIASKKHFRHHDRFQHHDKLRHNDRIHLRDRQLHDSKLKDRHLHHDGSKGKLIGKHKGKSFRLHG